jgi:hypothetical protein
MLKFEADTFRIHKMGSTIYHCWSYCKGGLLWPTPNAFTNLFIQNTYPERLIHSNLLSLLYKFGCLVSYNNIFSTGEAIFLSMRWDGCYVYWRGKDWEGNIVHYLKEYAWSEWRKPTSGRTVCFLLTFEVTFRMQLKTIVLPRSVCWVEIFIFSILHSNNITEMYVLT